MKIKQLVWTAAAVLALSNIASASAITWVDRDPDSGNGPLQFLSENGTTVFTSTFNIIPAGFIPGSHLVDTINVKFAFSDDDSDTQNEYVDITVGGFKIWNDLEVDGTHVSAPTSYEWFSQGLSGNMSILGDINADGILAYSVTIQNLSTSWRAEDTYLKIAELTAGGDFKPRTTGTPVPDGGATLGLFGVGLLGLGAIRRKLRKD
ncbi:MAG: VPDSG-CTERM sorting domain-containing protein [Verrucomicrobiota bacterium]